VSRDIFVQDIPAEARSVEDIPDGWTPAPLPFSREFIVSTVVDLAPSADFSDPSWGHVSLPGADIEVGVSDETPLMSFALHVRASDPATADMFVSRLLDRLGTRAFDPEGAPLSGIFGNG
jgi:hypothetical protein